MLNKIISICILIGICSTGFAEPIQDCKPESILKYLTGTWKGGNGITLTICANIQSQNDNIRKDEQHGYEEYDYPLRVSCKEDSSFITLISREPMSGSTLTSTVYKDNLSSLTSTSRLGSFVLGK